MHIYFLITVDVCIYYLHADCTEVYCALEGDVVIVYNIVHVQIKNMTSLLRTL